MRLASAQVGGGEAAVGLWDGNALPVAWLPGGWPADLFSLLEGGTCAYGGTGSPRRSWRA